MRHAKENHARFVSYKFKVSVSAFSVLWQLLYFMTITIISQPEWQTSEWSNCTALAPDTAANATAEENDEEEEGSGGKLLIMSRFDSLVV